MEFCLPKAIQNWTGCRVYWFHYGQMSRDKLTSSNTNNNGWHYSMNRTVLPRVPWSQIKSEYRRILKAVTWPVSSWVEVKSRLTDSIVYFMATLIWMFNTLLVGLTSWTLAPMDTNMTFWHNISSALNYTYGVCIVFESAFSYRKSRLTNW